MKKNLLLLMFFLMSGSIVNAMDWVPVDTNVSNFYLYVDADSIKNISPNEYLYSVKYQSGKSYEKVVYLKSNIQTNYMGIIKSEIFDEDNYHPKAVFANVHVYMKPLSNDSFLSLAHNYVSKLYMPKNENVDIDPINENKDAFTPPDNNEDVKEQNKDSETVSKPDIRGVSDKNIDNEKQKLNQEIKVEKVDSTKIKQQETQVSSQATSLKDYVAEVSIKLNENWQPPKSGQNTQTIVILTIGEDGSLQKYDIAKSSGDEATDRSIISAAEKSVPYAKFSGIKKGVNNIKLQFVFEYKKFKKAVM